jgi:hypothetical protein
MRGTWEANTLPGRSERRLRLAAALTLRPVNAFTVVCGGLLVFFVVTTVLLGLFSKRSALEILDWKPTRSPDVEAESEIDDVEQMIAAQNEIRARLGKPARTREDVEREWRAS